MKLLWALLLCLPLFAESKAFDVHRGRFTAGGSAAGALLIDKNDHVGWRLDLRPSFGYVPVDRLSIEGSVKYLIDPVEGALTNLRGFGILFHYYFKSNDFLYPFIGLGGDVEWLSKEFRGASVQFPLGLLFGLNEYVAIEVGLPIRLFIPNYDKGVVLIEVPLGYYGLKVFF